MRHIIPITPSMKYFIYCRKSQESEDRQILSLESQRLEISQLIAADTDAEIVDTYTEAFSAKAPGRELFDEMLNRIEAGEADGIISWHPDRLARNSMDGGRIIFLLDQGKLKDLKFCTYSFENSSQGKFMLNIIFGYSKYYIDSLSENIKRGQRMKIKTGWMPNRAPLGYRKCKETGHVLPDLEHFKVVRAMFELLLSGRHSVAAIHRIVCDDWAYVTPVRKTTGGKPLYVSHIHRLLTNPVYAGYIRWNDRLYEGAHKPVVSKSEFAHAQQILGLGPIRRPHKRVFTYAGLFTCGACGKAVTAEHKRKKSGLEYIYYHCTRIHTSPKCTQPSIEEKCLTAQVEDFLEHIYIPKEIVDWLLATLEDDPDQDAVATAERIKQHEDAVKRIERQFSNLTDLRLRDLLDDDEFEQKRSDLQIALAAAKEKHSDAAKTEFTFEPAKMMIILCSRAKDWFAKADLPARRNILKILCSNPQIIDKKAILQATKPFKDLRDCCENLVMCGKQDFVRTRELSNGSGLKGDLRTLLANLTSEDTDALQNLINQFEPETLRAQHIPCHDATPPSSTPRRDHTIVAPSLRPPRE